MGLAIVMQALVAIGYQHTSQQLARPEMSLNQKSLSYPFQA
jgi:hypothetical protein